MLIDTLGDRISAAARSQFDGKAWTVDHDLEVFPILLPARAGGYVAGLASAVAAGSRFRFAVSGGQAPWVMARALAAADMPWPSAPPR